MVQNLYVKLKPFGINISLNYYGSTLSKSIPSSSQFYLVLVEKCLNFEIFLFFQLYAFFFQIEILTNIMMKIAMQWFSEEVASIKMELGGILSFYWIYFGLTLLQVFIILTIQQNFLICHFLFLRNP